MPRYGRKSGGGSRGGRGVPSTPYESMKRGGGVHHRRAFSDYGPPRADTGKTHTTVYDGQGGRTSWDTQDGKESNKHTTKE